jgi:hypothetical protein
MSPFEKPYVVRAVDADGETNDGQMNFLTELIAGRQRGPCRLRRARRGAAKGRNVGPVMRGDVIELQIDGLPQLSVKIVWWSTTH